MAAPPAQGWGMFFGTINAIMPAGLALKTVIYLGILIAQFLCGLATVTSASRMLFAFSRDDGMPVGSKALATVSPQFRTPVNAIWTATVLHPLRGAGAVDQGGRHLDLRDRGELDAGLPVPQPSPSRWWQACFAYGTAKWPNPGPWAMSAGLYKLVTVLAVIGMGGDPVHRRGPAERAGALRRPGLHRPGAGPLGRGREPPLRRPADGENASAARKAAIAAAERAVGETGRSDRGGQPRRPRHA